MKTLKNNTTPAPVIRLINRHQQAVEFSSIVVATRILGIRWILHNVGLRFSDPAPAHAQYACRNLGDPLLTQYLLVTDSGRIIDPANLAAELATYGAPLYVYKPRSSLYSSLSKYNGKGPVPGSGKKSRGFYFLRRPKTSQAIRQALSVLKEEGEPPFRAKRRPRQVPDAFDDKVARGMLIKNWKRFRKSQYKKKDGDKTILLPGR